MKETTWKTLAIVFFILFILETTYIVWAFWYVTNEDNKTLECYYDVCSDYPDALYESNICYCYDYDVIGNLIIVKTEVIK